MDVLYSDIQIRLMKHMHFQMYHQEISNFAMILYDSSIKQNIPSNAIENANAIEFGLQQVKDMIDSKAPYNKVMGVIHGPLQSNIQEAFNLPLKTSK
jgi:hypothetical protein